ncbi:diguanylate cyclase (GGDEF)-like protein [Hypnocyclicus thermotrophus]|uniref:Diguanylate cyclase (GGDEF)-like protein n=1 Tax=Hypnocyclicus thermotrophus TaxID=1627895 RepID=A0AA46E001_9FUSO|nr:GGDEF domain-containing protein [Hypnocyclicus thermotrophus]TDT72020.1 diguanylate cyclase (GGDEF)-like protein [Hypnocyclicus thermotrophus]
MCSEKELKGKFSRLFIFGSIFLSILSIIINLIFKLELIINLKWLIIIFSSLIVLIYDSFLMYFLYFVVIILLFIPIGFIDSGGNLAISISYIYMLLFLITYLFEKKAKCCLISCIFIATSIIINIHLFHSNIFRIYHKNLKSYDTIFQIFLVLIFNCFLLNLFYNIYKKNQILLKKSNEQLTTFAMYDSLTNVYNRRAFDDRLLSLLKSKEHLYDDIWLILIDIDDFKLINDKCGHDEGDRIIKTISNTINTYLGNYSFVARWGGDEFAIITNLPYVKLHRKVDLLFNRVLSLIRNDNEKVTISCGITKLLPEDKINSIFIRADKLLYKAKKLGKNRYIFD